MILLALGLFLLLTGSGEAGEKVITWAEPECSNEACKQRGDTCYQRMQEAMKAVDPYLPHPPPTMVFDDLIPRYCDQICQAEKALKEAKQQTKVLNQWISVMRDCVKETP